MPIGETFKYLDFKMVLLLQVNRINDSSKNIFQSTNYLAAIKDFEMQINVLEMMILPYIVLGDDEKVLKEINNSIDYEHLKFEETYRIFINALLRKYSLLVKYLRYFGINPVIEITERWVDDKKDTAKN